LERSENKNFGRTLPSLPFLAARHVKVKVLVIQGLGHQLQVQDIGLDFRLDHTASQGERRNFSRGGLKF